MGRRKLQPNAVPEEAKLRCLYACMHRSLALLDTSRDLKE